MAQRIIVIDDDDAILDFYTLLLEGEGYEVHVSKVFFENVQEIERLAPSLIILDMMQGHHIQGLSLLKKLQAYPPTQTIPIIVSTAAVREILQYEESFQQAGIPIIYKPFDIDELLRVVKQQLGSSHT